MVLVSDNSVSQINASIQSNYETSCTKLKNILYNADAVSLGINSIQEKIRNVSNAINSNITTYTNQYIDDKLSTLNMCCCDSYKYITKLTQENGLIAANANNIPDASNRYCASTSRYLDSNTETTATGTYDINIPENSYFIITFFIIGLDYYYGSQKIRIIPYNGTWNIAFAPKIVSISDWEPYISNQHLLKYMSSAGYRHYYDLYGYGCPNGQSEGYSWEGDKYYPAIQISGYTKDYPITNFAVVFDTPNKYIYSNAGNDRCANDSFLRFHYYVSYESKLEV